MDEIENNIFYLKWRTHSVFVPPFELPKFEPLHLNYLYTPLQVLYYLAN